MRILRALLVFALLLGLLWAAINYVYGSSSLPEKVEVFGQTLTLPQAPAWLDADVRRQPEPNQPQFITNSNQIDGPKLDAATTQDVADKVAAGLQLTLERTQEFASRSGEVLGEIVQVNEGDKEKAVHERALEHAQYLYCKAVVEDYEKRQ